MIRGLSRSRQPIFEKQVALMKFAFYTLGCKVNQYETQAMEHLLLAQGHTLGQFTDVCDGYIINTCTVTAVGDKKSRNAIRRARKQNPRAIIGVCGCYAQTHLEAVRLLPVDVIGGSGQRREFLARMVQACQEQAGDALSSREQVPPEQGNDALSSCKQSPQEPGDAPLPCPRPVRRELVDDALSRREFEILPAGGLLERTRGMLKVQDGCVNFCSYCIIPYARGPVRSLPIDQAVAQALSCRDMGYRELVVTGIEISSWGQDLKNGQTLSDLLMALCRAVPELRIRLGSLEPRTITREFCQRMKGFPNLCPQFHLSLQSGSDRVLKRMNRKYDTARYRESVELLRQHFPGCAVTTDLIVGFPGETEEEFAQSLAFLETCRFAWVHVFPYSRRPGTPAARMEGQIPLAVKETRSARALEVAGRLKEACLASLQGSHQAVLFEQEAQGLSWGHCPNGVKVYCPVTGVHNQVLSVQLDRPHSDGMLASLPEEKGR